MPDENTNTTEGVDDWDKKLNEGTEAEDETTDENNDNTSENVSQNDPKKNKKLAKITIAEQLRNTYQLTLKIPRIFKEIHTNQFFFMELSDDFYETNYETIITPIADEKYGRFAGFKKGRFFIDKIVEKGGIDGFSTELTLNPLPKDLGEYARMQMEAEKALLEAYAYENRGGGSGGSSVNVSGVDCTPGDSTESHNWAGHRCNPPKCTSVGKTIHGNSSRQYAKDTASHNGSSQELVEWVHSQCKYEYYADNPHGEKRCPEAMWTGPRPIRGNCADYARMLKCILDVNGYQSIICHIPGHFYNAIWENNDWTVCDLCSHLHGKSAYGHANHGDVKPTGTWDNPEG